MENDKPRTPTAQVNTVFNRLRARLYSLMETALPKDQAVAAKKSIKDFTSQSWLDINKIVENNDLREVK